jgi:sugar lactone lactonase YvrE
LIVADSYNKKHTAFGIADEGGPSTQRVWAELDEDTPDGICMDAEGSV